MLYKASMMFWLVSLSAFWLQGVSYSSGNEFVVINENGAGVYGLPVKSAVRPKKVFPFRSHVFVEKKEGAMWYVNGYINNEYNEGWIHLGDVKSLYNFNKKVELEKKIYQEKKYMMTDSDFTPIREEPKATSIVIGFLEKEMIPVQVTEKYVSYFKIRCPFYTDRKTGKIIHKEIDGWVSVDELIVSEYDIKSMYYKVKSDHELLKKEQIKAEEYQRHLETEKIKKEELKKKNAILSLEAEAKKIPVEQYEKNLSIYKKLHNLDSKNQRYIDKIAFYENKIKYRKSEKKRETENELVSKGYILELKSWHWGEDYGYAIAHGEIKNLTNKKIENIQVVVSWYTENDQLITSDSALIEYNVLMPKQVSPFRVTEKYNPMMKYARINFKVFNGGLLQTYRSKE